MRKSIFKMAVVLKICFFSVVGQAQTAADSMLALMAKRNATTSVYVLQNNSNTVSVNAEETMPIACLSDLLIAIEYAKQATYKLIDTGQKISLKELAKYYISNDYQPEYENWFADMVQSDRVKNDTSSFLDVLKGLHHYGAQPNAEYILDRIGFDNVRSSIVSYNMTNHTNLAPPMSSLALYQNRANTTEKKLYKAINDMDDDTYYNAAYVMHVAMKSDTSFKRKIPSNFINEKVMQTWSYKLAQGSTKGYGLLLQTILKEKMLDAKFYKMLRNIIENPEQAPMLSEDKQRFMLKKSETINTFAVAQFAKEKSGKESVVVYTIFEVTPAERNSLNRWYQSFNHNITTDASFLAKVKSTLTNTTNINKKKGAKKKK
jgi:hypothetical protein